MNLNRRKIFSAPVAVLAFASVPLPAFALFGGGGRIVYDPKNHVENIITAIKTTKMLIESIKTNMNGQTYAGTFANSAEMQEMLAVANATDAALKNSKKVMEDLNNVYGASPYENWDQFSANIAKRKEAGDKQAQILYDSAFAADKQVRLAHEANQKIQSSSRNSSGPTEAIQSTVNALGVVIDQNNNMLYAMSSANKMQAQELERQATEREQLEKSKKEYFDKVKKAQEEDTKILRGAGVKPLN